jgi:hypothetical protein
MAPSSVTGVNSTLGGCSSSSPSLLFSGLMSGFVTLLNVNGCELEQSNVKFMQGR